MDLLNLITGGFHRAEEYVGDKVLAARAIAFNQELAIRAPVINDCTDRQDFAVTLLASGLAGHPCLLPSSSAPEVIDELKVLYPDAHHVRRVPPGRSSKHMLQMYPIDPDSIAVVAFTSGSTGEPKALTKSWRALQEGATRLMHTMGLDEQPANIVTTVPPQHMYGLETSILTVLFGSNKVCAGRPFYPIDVAEQLAHLSPPRVLVTTPLHLRAIAKSGVALAPLAKVISATSTLDLELALTIEAYLRCPLMEIYGSTETGSIASRQLTQSDIWTLFPDVHFSDAESGRLHAPHLGNDAALLDTIRIHDPQHFTLLGRPEGMLKVAGKRYSVDALTAKLLAIPGVEDAAVLLPKGADRPAALVVAPTLTVAQLRGTLATQVDAVFLPRPLKLVPSIPRNATGKTRAAELLTLLNQTA